jgi:tRNA-splicing ligase RtcB
MEIRRIWLEIAKKLIPAGEGHAHKAEQEWDNFQGKENYGAHLSYSNLDRRNLGTIGGGNHFCELQKSDDGFVCIMIHSGSRNFGQRLEKAYLAYAQDLCETMHVRLPDPALAFLPMNMDIGKRSNQLLSETGDVKFDYSCPGWDYMVDLNLALEYALENRIRISNWAIDAIEEALGKEVSIAEAYDVHHNYAAIENHCGENLIVHRKGATRAMKDEIGIIPGSMGTASYIVKGLGNEASFCSCSHGAGRRMSRTTANTSLTVADCDSAMNGIVFDRWHKCKSFKDGQSVIDLSESPQAYKDIDEVIRNESDLVVPVLKLTPLAVLKG